MIRSFFVQDYSWDEPSSSKSGAEQVYMPGAASSTAESTGVVPMVSAESCVGVGG